MTVEGKWVWQSTGTLFSYSAWDMARGQPNNYANQDCLSLYRPYGLGFESGYIYSVYRGIINMHRSYSK